MADASASAPLPAHLASLFSTLMDAQVGVHSAAATELRKLLCASRGAPFSEVMAAPNIVERLVQFLAPEHAPALQFEASWCLCILASNGHAGRVVECGAVSHLVRQLRDDANLDVREQAVWTLAMIAKDSAAHRDAVLSAGAIQPLATLCSFASTPLSTLRNAVYALMTLCAPYASPPAFATIAAVVPVFTRVLSSSTDEEMLTDACQGLGYLVAQEAQDPAAARAVVLDSGAMQHLLRLTKHASSAVAAAAGDTAGLLRAP